MRLPVATVCDLRHTTFVDITSVTLWRPVNRNTLRAAMAAVVIQHPQHSECGIVCAVCGAFVPLPGASPDTQGALECRECGYHVGEPETPSI